MKIQGIIKGNTIELLDQILDKILLPDGVKISIEIPDNLIIKQPKWQELEAVIGLWKDDTEIDEIFDIINQERHQDLGREINLDS
ncbi:hypothetical protein BMF77_01071 [Dolichospermum sp. UHCC 0315A]|uniref:hypothetical protein n=1 Tax=unclassified Dolichospermum TaxID=2622029 RepID=UPI0011E6EFB9|nr:MULTISPECIES: hypothetical protein [unclassified Dolichospermum]MTJ23176.1 hypothetical protein [Dolichospermum sp. UHCC 0352]QEI40502.1 hypothetical protein BMF77_01071 [Dolichospermum sp. UHCC 0315A]